MKRVFALILALTLMLSLCACGAAEKTFTCGDLSITLTSAFEESSVEGQDAYYESRKVGVTVLKEEKANLANGENMTKKEYAELIVQTQGKNTVGSVMDLSDLTYFTFTSVVDGTAYTYQVYIYENDTAFYMVQFFCHSDNYGKLLESFQKWARTVTIAGADSSNDTDSTTEATTEATTEPAVKTKSFVCGDVTMVLPEEFEETSAEGQDGAYLSDNAGAMVFTQTKAELTNLGYNGSTMTKKEYADAIISANEQQAQDVKEENGLTTYVYTASTENYNFTYQAFIFESDDAFHMVQFYCLSASYETLAPSFAQWASQVVIA